MTDNVLMAKKKSSTGNTGDRHKPARMTRIRPRLAAQPIFSPIAATRISPNRSTWRFVCCLSRKASAA